MKNKPVTILITTWPFAAADDRPRRALRRAGVTILEPARRTRQKLTPAELRRWLPRADAVIAGTERYDEELLRLAPRLKLISRVGIGLDSLDFGAARRRGVEVAYTPEAPTEAVAELALGLMLDCLRRVREADHELRQGRWNRQIGRELRGLTVGIIGFGRIGKRVAELLRPFGCRILANDVRPLHAAARRRGARLVSKDELYRRSDVVTLHLPLTAKTRNVIDAHTLRRFRPGAILVNTARGGLVDERALIAALRSGRLAAAGLDVFVAEPYRGGLTKLANTVLTAHMGSCTDTSRLAMEMGAVNNLLAFFAGKRAWGRVPDGEREE